MSYEILYVFIKKHAQANGNDTIDLMIHVLFYSARE